MSYVSHIQRETEISGNRRYWKEGVLRHSWHDLSSPAIRVCLLCLRHQEQTCGPSEGRGKPGLDDASCFLSPSLALSLSNLITTRPQGMGPAGAVCQGTMPTSGQMVLRFYNFKPISRRYNYMIGWCSAPHRKPGWRRIDHNSGKERVNVNSESPRSHTDSNGE